MVDSEKNSCVRDAWSWGRCGFRSEPGVGGLGRREGVERVWNRRMGGELCGGAALHTTSDGSVCGQGGCQALGLWIAGVGRKMSKNRKDGTG